MSSLYSPYRAIGYVCDSNPFTINRLGEEIFITVTIGKCFQIFRLDKLVACLVSKNAPGEISCAQAIGHDTFIAVGSDIIVYDRANIVRKYSVHTENIVGMVSVGHILVSFDQGNRIKVINTKERNVLGEMQLLQDGKITAIVHPATYINKFVVGFSNGQLELWNFNSRKLLYTFKAHLTYFHKYDEGDSTSAAPAVTCAEQSPASDVLGIGFSNGLIVLMNMKLDIVLFSFSQNGGPVTSLSFRTDSSAEKCPFMASSSADGRVHIWNLGTERPGFEDDDDFTGFGRTSMVRKLQCSLDEAHVGPVSKVEFVHGEPIMITAGAEDNSLKVWIFDAPDGSARLLRSREGHRGAPSRIRYYGGTTHVSMRDNADAMSCELVSAGTDGTLRLFNTAIEAQNREMSQKPLLKKLGMQRRNERLPQCIGFDFSETRQRDWGNLVTIHRDSANAYVWKYKHRVATEMVLRQPHWKTNSLKYVIDRRTHATSVALSPCGNFAIVGTRGGDTFKYNLQSGLPRGSFPIIAATSAEQNAIAKKSAIPGNIYHDMKVMLGEQAVSLNKPKQDASAQVPIDQQVGHTQEVSGIFVDMLGVTMVTCGYDGLICFWDFNTQELVHKVELSCPQLLLQGFRDAGFCAVAGQDRVIRLFDMSTQKLSRRFAGGHSREITDLAFSPDGRRLLSSALDSTLRVWDLPTGRCLNWLQFQSPILSMAVSLSGEYLCLAQAEKEGIYMYIDRSLYETVHFWKEPTEPSPVSDSLVLAADGDDVQGAGSQQHSGSDEVDGNENSRSITVVPPQAQVNALEGENRESAEQRGAPGTITMSAVPRAYWTSLFNLEAIKQRNRPTAAPAPAPQAPFFLPSVVRAGGSAPSFPTPAEYAKLTAQLQNNSSGATGSVAGVGEKRSGGSDESADSAASSKKAKLPEQQHVDPSEEDVLNELAAMGSAWADDGAGDWGESGTVGWSLDTSAAAENEKEVMVADNRNDIARSGKKSNSRIISKKTQLPRCKLAAYLLAEPEYSDSSRTSTSPVLGYLKKLAPPAVDLELRALYTHDEDEEGRALLQQLLRWLSHHIVSGDNFEILQAYLHRTLAIYMTMAVNAPVLVQELQQLKKAHAEASSRFRHLVQKNLCLLKIMGNLPIA